jgi:methionyl-tRNA formyltransferase
MRLIFMGTPDFAVPTLKALISAGHDIAAVYTRAAKLGGRGMELQPTPVEREARRLGLPVFTPKTLKEEAAQAEFRAHKADAAVVVAYGLILPKPILEEPRLGCFNVHASLLPRWRGAAPINRAIMEGDKESGITIMKMDEGLDTGPIVRTKSVAIARNMTAGELHDVLARIGATRMPIALRTAERGKASPTPQLNQDVTYAEKISKNETRIDWTKSWDDVHNHIRGLSPFPGAWFEIARIRIKALGSKRGRRGKKRAAPGTVLDDRLTIACGDGAVRLMQVQREGKKPMSAEEFLRGTKVEPGARLS